MIKILMLILLLITACSRDVKQMADVTLTTEDDVKISASYLKGNEVGIILLHMLGRDKSSWSALPKELNGKGYSVLSIDLRGHGKSELNYREFADDDWKNLVKDVKAAAFFLKSKNVNEIYIIGASIGANSAINYASEDNSVKGVALLSPGMTYRGIHVSDDISKYKGRILLVSTEEDTYSYDSVNKMKGLNPSAEILKYNGSAHGTEMFVGTDLKEKILEWLELN